MEAGTGKDWRGLQAKRWELRTYERSHNLHTLRLFSITLDQIKWPIHTFQTNRTTNLFYWNSNTSQPLKNMYIREMTTHSLWYWVKKLFWASSYANGFIDSFVLFYAKNWIVKHEQLYTDCIFNNNIDTRSSFPTNEWDDRQIKQHKRFHVQEKGNDRGSQRS